MGWRCSSARRSRRLISRVARPGADDLPVAFEPHFTGGITGKVLAVGLREQRTQMQRSDALLDVQVHHHGGVMPVRAAGGLGVPPGLHQTHERLTGARQRRCLIRGAVAIVVIGIVVIVFPLGDQRIMMRLQRRVERRRLGVTEA